MIHFRMSIQVHNIALTSAFISQHEAGHAAFEDACKQIDDIKGKLQIKNVEMSNIQEDIEEKEREVVEAQRVEQVRN